MPNNTQSNTTPEEEAAWAAYQKAQQPQPGPWSQGDSDLPPAIQKVDRELDRKGVPSIIAPVGGGLLTETGEVAAPSAFKLYNSGPIKNLPPPSAPLFEAEPTSSAAQAAAEAKAPVEAEAAQESKGLLSKALSHSKDIAETGIGAGLFWEHAVPESVKEKVKEVSKEAPTFAAGLIPEGIRNKVFGFARKLTGSDETTPEEEAAWEAYQRSQSSNKSR